MSFWTDERIERLKKLWAEGLSCSQIAEAMHAPSRNSVIGKVHRLKLAGRAKTPAKPHRPRKRVVKAHPWRLVPAQPKLISDVPTQPVEASMVVPVKQRRSLLELRAGECKWPHGDPQDRENFYFCGAKAVDDRPYCLAHCRIAYQRPEDRRRRKAA